MSKKQSIFAAGLTLLLVTLACNFVAPPQFPQVTSTPVVSSTSLPLTVVAEPTSSTQQDNLPLNEAAVPRVPVEEAKAALDTGAAIIVDVRSVEAYQAKHIKGAISIPLADIESNPTGLKLDKEQWIITYCT
jgi:3-mercaptopyruvate sulfurtransferase SseA